MTENEKLQEENRRLREALEPFVNLANRFAAKTEGCEGIEDYDRIRVEYGWAEFNSFIRVRDLRAALATAVAPPDTIPESDFRREIERLLANGWSLAGGIAVSVSPNGCQEFFQAMTSREQPLLRSTGEGRDAD